MNCPECLEAATRTDWVPPLGLDPNLIEYRCDKCGFKFYAPTRNRYPDEKSEKAPLAIERLM